MFGGEVNLFRGSKEIVLKIFYAIVAIFRVIHSAEDHSMIKICRAKMIFSLRRPLLARAASFSGKKRARNGWRKLRMLANL